MGAGKAMIISAADSSVDIICELLKPLGIGQTVIAKSGGEARRLGGGFELIIINAPLPDEMGIELACDLAGRSHAGMILLVKRDIFSEIAGKAERHGVLTVAKPFSRQLFRQILSLSLATNARITGLEQENRRLQNRIDDMKIINRAKWTLTQYLQMSEDQAHHYIEKQAMDMRLPVREIAESIIKMYES